ncbi:MAG: dienelactone hydrolase family protein [Actinobacteria bacterium]|nr:dienelactone hydrolase family protein [Actinomycetota bacterium]
MRTTLPTGTPAEVARPDGEPGRGLVLLPDIGGLRPLFDDHAGRLAREQGWVVVVPEPWPGREHLPVEERLESVGSLDDDVVLGDALAAADLCGVEPVGVLGFCMGGMFALKAAATSRFDRAVAFYGMVRLPDRWRSPTQAEPLDAVARAHRTRVLMLCGTEDPWVSAADLDALELAGAEVVRYPGADHGFAHDSGRPAHRPDAAADAWRRATAFLRGD